MLLDDEPKEPKTPTWLKVAGIIGGAAIVGGLVTSVVYGMLKDGGPRKKPAVQEISVLRPPPPPPPPKVEEKPPEPEMKKEEVKIPDEKPEPTPQAEQPPPGDKLSVDAAGSGTGDNFGLGAKPGGQDLTTIGGGGGDRAAWYSGRVLAQLKKVLSRYDRLRGVEFKVVVQVWLDAEGGVRRVELLESSGDVDKDKKIRLALAETPPLKDAPPEGTPRSMKFLLASNY